LKAASAGYNGVKLSWSAVPGANEYKIYRATKSSGTYSLIKTTTSLSYTNTGLTAGSTYYYRIRAYQTGKKVYSKYSSVVSAKPIPATPANLKAAKTSSTSIKLTWNGVSGASGYEIYRAASSTGTYSLIKSTTSCSYSNTSLAKGKTYYYKIRAYKTVNGKKIYSSYTSVVSAKT
jgi:fibronectin type 3 domain-containing protein